MKEKNLFVQVMTKSLWNRQFCDITSQGALADYYWAMFDRRFEGVWSQVLASSCFTKITLHQQWIKPWDSCLLILDDIISRARSFIFISFWQAPQIIIEQSSIGVLRMFEVKCCIIILYQNHIASTMDKTLGFCLYSSFMKLISSIIVKVGSFLFLRLFYKYSYLLLL